MSVGQVAPRLWVLGPVFEICAWKVFPEVESSGALENMSPMFSTLIRRSRCSNRHVSWPQCATRNEFGRGQWREESCSQTCLSLHVLVQVAGEEGLCSPSTRDVPALLQLRLPCRNLRVTHLPYASRRGWLLCEACPSPFPGDERRK